MSAPRFLIRFAALFLFFPASTPQLSASAVKPPQNIIIEGRRAPSEAAVSATSIRYSPFLVPEGVTRITVKRSYDHGPDPKQRNTVDLGLFDPRGYRYGGPGFRGWQGGHPGDLVLTGHADTSAPWYLPGPIPAGRWHLAQWYIRPTPSGLGYRYTVTFDFDGPKPPRRMRAVPPYRPGVLNPKPGWYAGNLHTHTIHSDGGRTLAEVVARNRAAGFDFMASTDHNTPRAHYELAGAARAHPDHLLLAGVEFTSPFGHANLIGMHPGHWFDFRIDGGDGRLPGIIRESHRQGAIFILNHPFAGCTTCSWRYPAEEWQEADAIEVWNGAWTPDDRQALNLWDDLLRSGRRIHALGGTDYHRGEDPLLPVVWVHADRLSQPAIMEGLRQGRAFLSESPKGPELYLTANEGKTLPGDTLLVNRGRGSVPVEVRVRGGKGLTLRLIGPDLDRQIRVEGDEITIREAITGDAARPRSYLRAELLREDGRMAALTNPIYLQIR
ncbi:MAG: CehA/McbA family metallohydrolase, partial [Armatimonadetes bacterium]|nr:CehA/McbA family metallohydrolase [Armatimonadota bacterium]